MTVMLIRKQAKEIAGVYSEGHERTSRFRKTWPNQRKYVAENWPHFIDLAREALVRLMIAPGTTQHVKDEIYEALKEDNRRVQSDPNAREVAQASLVPVEIEDRKFIDNNPQMIERGLNHG
jgi:hypothetical protein